MKINDLQLWESYAEVAKQGNFAKASRSLRIPVSQVSKRVAKLESSLGVKLFQRSTRHVHLTDEGKGLLERAVLLLDDSRMLERTFEEKFNLSGTLRITSVTHLAHRILIPVLKEFHGLYPEVQVEMDVSDTFQNLIESKFDLAFRIDEPEDSEMVYSWLFANELVICTAPGYLDRNPHPLKSPKDLAKHSVLIYESVKSACFRKSGKPLREFIQQQKFLSESGPFLVDLARQGLGVLVRSRWDIQSDLDEGTLIEVLPNHPLESWGNAYAVIPSRRYLAPRVRALLELVKSAVKK